MSGRLFIGTSGWSYDDWTGRFYPEGMDRCEWLTYYATHFQAVELNVTFYRLPFANMVKSWSQRAPPGFVFAAKGSRTVTHRLRLQDAAGEVARFYERLSSLKGLEVVLWQLPPSLRSDSKLLDEFLSIVPPAPRRVIEFRHTSWWNEDTRDILRRHKAAFCAISHPRLPDSFCDTADFCYIRFHGLGKRLYDYYYRDEELRPFVEVVSAVLSSDRDAYVFFNNDYHANAIINARTFRTLVLDCMKVSSPGLVSV